jgi:RcsF protein
MSKVLPLISLVILFVCSSCSYFSFSTNLDPDNFREYYKNAQLQTYDKSILPDLNYIELGTVEGVSCQAFEEDPIASIYDAKQNAKELAAKKEANGIVYTSCIELENTPGCLTSVSCYARAIYVKE